MIKFFSRNLVDQAVIVPSSENLLFPRKNLIHHFRTKVLRTLDNESSVTFDFGETSEADSVVIIDNPKVGFGFVTAKIQFSHTMNFDAPGFEQDIVINQKHHWAFTEFPVQSYRYARLVLTSTIGYCELSNIFIGKAITDEHLNIEFGWDYQSLDLSKVKENDYGQKFIDIIGRQSIMSFSFSALNPEEIDLLLEMIDTKGTTKPFFIKIGTTDMINDPDRFAGMFFFRTVPKTNNRTFALYDSPISIEEAL